MNKTLQTGITLGITCGGNIRALTMAILSAINGRAVPHKILVRLEGDLPGFDDYYLAQAAEFARLCGIEFQLNCALSTGIRDARDWLIDNCSTAWLWMLDDDCLVAPDCLEYLCRSKLDEDTFAIQGCKPDLNNRRGYPDFFPGVHPHTELKDGASPNHRWDQLPGDLLDKTKALLPSYVIHTIDTGNVMLNIEKVARLGTRFKIFEDSVNSGGEDTLFALYGIKRGGNVRLMPWAVAYHLEKPNVRFNEFAARGEMISRAMDALNMGPELKEKMRPEMMAWIWQRDNTGQIKKFLDELPKDHEENHEDQDEEDIESLRRKNAEAKARRLEEENRDEDEETPPVRVAGVASEIRRETLERETEQGGQAGASEANQGAGENSQPVSEADRQDGRSEAQEACHGSENQAVS